MTEDKEKELRTQTQKEVLAELKRAINEQMYNQLIKSHIKSRKINFIRNKLLYLKICTHSITCVHI